MKRKIKPSLPNTLSIAYGLLDDDCYGCKSRNACGNCPRAKYFVGKQKDKKKKLFRKKIYDYF